MNHNFAALGCGLCALITLLVTPACSQGIGEIDTMVDIGALVDIGTTGCTYAASGRANPSSYSTRGLVIWQRIGTASKNCWPRTLECARMTGLLWLRANPVQCLEVDNGPQADSAATGQRRRRRDRMCL